jgi:hypothetical protein
LSSGIWRHRVEIGSIDLIQPEKEIDAPWTETGRLKLRAALNRNELAALALASCERPLPAV